jgi:hypothetical protein
LIGESSGVNFSTRERPCDEVYPALQDECHLDDLVRRMNGERRLTFRRRRKSFEVSELSGTIVEKMTNIFRNQKIGSGFVASMVAGHVFFFCKGKY